MQDKNRIPYDNPESYVPGGYSATAAKVMRAAQKILFANANLAATPLYEAPAQEIHLPCEKRVGIGYYPVAQAEKIAKRRASDQELLRAQFFAKHSLKDQNRKILVYAGGNNEEYFTKAFPALLQFLGETSSQTDLSRFVILLQQHPGAKEKDLDGKQLRQWAAQQGQNAPQFLLSELNSEDAQVLADGMLYYQTSMGPQFVLAGIPTIQVGHNVYEDILVKNDLCPAATNAAKLREAITRLQKPKSDTRAVEQGLGIRSDWKSRLESAIVTDFPCR